MLHPEAAVPDAAVVTESPGSLSPDYERLVRLLLGPLVSSQETLKVHCEVYAGGQRVWLRVAVEEGDRGRVFGRGARNLDAVRTVLRVAGTTIAQAVHLEVYDNNPSSGRERRGRRPAGGAREGSTR